MIKDLENEFIGTGEVKDFKFVKIDAHEYGYLYEVWVEDTLSHYEVFIKKVVPLCIDFVNRIWSETEFKVVYPNAKDFGITAWTYTNKKDALDRLNKIAIDEERRIREKSNTNK